MINFIDEKFREAVWVSKIPIKLDMALEDINDTEKPPSLYVSSILIYISLISPDSATSQT